MIKWEWVRKFNNEMKLFKVSISFKNPLKFDTYFFITIQKGKNFFLYMVGQVYKNLIFDFWSHYSTLESQYSTWKQPSLKYSLSQYLFLSVFYDYYGQVNNTLKLKHSHFTSRNTLLYNANLTKRVNLTTQWIQIHFKVINIFWLRCTNLKFA